MLKIGDKVKCVDLPVQSADSKIRKTPIYVVVAEETKDGIQTVLIKHSKTEEMMGFWRSDRFEVVE